MSVRSCQLYLFTVQYKDPEDQTVRKIPKAKHSLFFLYLCCMFYSFSGANCCRMVEIWDSGCHLRNPIIFSPLFWDKQWYIMTYVLWYFFAYRGFVRPNKRSFPVSRKTNPIIHRVSPKSIDVYWIKDGIIVNPLCSVQ